VFIPQDAPWLADYLHELAMFPKGKFDDQVDSTSQALGLG
jgi:predicted phage terminase large subunit-like protein